MLSTPVYESHDFWKVHQNKKQGKTFFQKTTYFFFSQNTLLNWMYNNVYIFVCSIL